MSPASRPSGEAAGLHLLLRLPEGRDPDQVATLAAKHDVQLENATWHWAQPCSAPPPCWSGTARSVSTRWRMASRHSRPSPGESPRSVREKLKRAPIADPQAVAAA